MQLATKYALIFFSPPITAAFFLLFTFISGPGSKIWLVVAETEAHGTIKVGALGICAADQCLSSGLGYDPGTQLGTIIPRFPAIGICHLITFIVILLGTCSHIYILPRLHRIRDTRLGWIMWIVPALCALLTVICVIIDFALLSQLKNGKALRGAQFGTGGGLQAMGGVANGTVANVSSSYAPNGTVLSAPTAMATYGTIPSAQQNPTAPPISASSTVSVNIPPGMASIPAGNHPAGVPAKLSLRALSNSTIPAAPQTVPSSAPKVTAGGAFYLPIITLLLLLIWLYHGTHFLRKSKLSEEIKESDEKEKWHSELRARKQVQEENPVEGNYGWFNFGKPGAGKQQGGEEKAQGGGGWGLPAWISGGDRDAAPSGYV